MSQVRKALTNLLFINIIYTCVFDKSEKEDRMNIYEYFQPFINVCPERKK